MMINNRSMPSNVVIPVLNYADVPRAITFLTEKLGFKVRLRIEDHRAQ